MSTPIRAGTDGSSLDSDAKMSPDKSTVTDCPVCGDESRHNWRFEKKGHHFYRCGTCRTEKQHPLPSRADLQTYYNNEYHHGIYRTFTSAASMKDMTAVQRMREISKVIPTEGRWLDVGCANGVFVKLAESNSEIVAEGIELSDVAVNQAVEDGVRVRCGAIDDMEALPIFDCITAFDVIEHVIDPKTFMKDIADRLKTGGFAAFTLPNRASIFSRVMGPRWWFYIPEEHLHYFDHKNIAKLFENAGLEVLSVSRTFKPLSYNYGLTQFVESNPRIYKVLKGLGRILPNALRELIVPLYIGEMKVIARKTKTDR